ncbi:MAG TPA: sulfatase-like hydrolase/transferase [Solirubrobacterales bacterium]|jgi:phosphoglycerol transferase MdoB-like AlkP superfamily enzyme
MDSGNLLQRTRGLLSESRFRLSLLFIAFLMTVSLLTRLGLIAAQGAIARDGAGPVLRALGTGEAYDTLAALWLAAPFVLYLAAVPERWFRSRVQRALIATGLALAGYGVLFVAVVEQFFFAEFNGRFNFVAVDYLMYPTEVVTNIWESYPTGSVLALLAAVTLGLAWPLHRSLPGAWRRPAGLAERGAVLGAFALALAGMTLGVPAGLAHVSEDRALNEIAENGYHSFWQALLGSDAPYEGLYATRDHAAVFRRLHRLLAEPAAGPASFAPGSTLRHVRGLGPERRLNVVVVLEESLGSEFIGALHPRPASLTPEFDALAAQGTLLTRAYSTGNRTIRALEATTSSLPPLPGISIVRRPRSEHLFTLPALLAGRGYQTLFVYGGRALFDGMGRYLRHNGVERIVEQGDFPGETFRTAWGVADEAIFDRALVEMDAMAATGRPFYTLILSVSNHRPFTFPAGPLRPDPALSRRENAVRYADWALGRFLRRAKEHAFFSDTLFVLMGDHGARVYGAAEIPLASYEVPILFYAPGVMPAGRRVDTLASSLDVPPTVLGVLGLGYDSKFFGHDVFRVDPAQGRALMTHNSEIALMQGSRVAVLGLHGAIRLYGYDRASGRFKPARPDAAGRELIEDAIAYYDGADTLYRRGAYAFSGPPAERLAAVHRPGLRGRSS